MTNGVEDAISSTVTTHDSGLHTLPQNGSKTEICIILMKIIISRIMFPVSMEIKTVSSNCAKYYNQVHLLF
jgi:hypothetical protein